MSCERCELEQDNITMIRHNEEAVNHCYIRVGAANILVIGCRDHLKQLVEERRNK